MPIILTMMTATADRRIAQRPKRLRTKKSMQCLCGDFPRPFLG